MQAGNTGGYMRGFLASFGNVLRRKDIRPPLTAASNSGSSTTTMQKHPLDAALPAEVAESTKNLKFSDSQAYFGVDKRELVDKEAALRSLDYLRAFDSSAYKRKVAISFWCSFAAVCIYFWFSRRDYNGFLNAPKYELVPTLKRYALRQQIERARKNGKDTTYLEAALAYVDVEEAVYRAEDGAFTLHS